MEPHAVSRGPDPARSDAASQADVPPSFEGELNALVCAETRRSSRVTLPFMLPALYAMKVVLGAASALPAVRVALWVQVAIVFARGGLHWTFSHPAHPGWVAWSPARRAAFVASTWMLSVGFAAIYVTAAPSLDAERLLMLAAIATAICTGAMMSAATSVFTYVGYLFINLGSLAFVFVRDAPSRLVPIVPTLLGVFGVILTLIASRSHLALREKITLDLRLRELAVRDALTGLRNRSFMGGFAEQRAAQIANQWVGRGRRAPGPERSLVLLLIDLDHFKVVNDTHGHAAGDQVLVTFARIAESAVRAQDVVARWGGEEFLVVAEVDDRASAREVGDRIRRKLTASPIALQGGQSVPMTCSIGACLFPFDPARPGDLTWQETLELADGALYQAKREGRNRTLCVTPGGAPSLPREALAAARLGVTHAVAHGLITVRGPTEAAAPSSGSPHPRHDATGCWAPT